MTRCCRTVAAGLACCFALAAVPAFAQARRPAVDAEAHVLLRRADAYAARTARDRERARALYEEVIARRPHAEAAVDARLGLGSLAEKGGDLDEAALRYKQVVGIAGLIQKGPAWFAMRVHGARAVAALARIRERQGRYAEAAGWWRQWRDASTCGVGMEATEFERRTKVLALLVKAGRPEEALRELDPLLSGRDSNAAYAVLYVDLWLRAHPGAAGEAALERRLKDAHARRPPKKNADEYADPSPWLAEAALDYLNAVVRPARRGDAAALAARLGAPPPGRPYYFHFDGDARDARISSLLTGMDPARVRPLLVRAAKSAPAGERGEVRRLWTARTLARMRAPEALSVIRAGFATGASGWQYVQLLERDGSLAARRELRHIAAGRESGRTFARRETARGAEEALKRLAAGQALPSDHATDVAAAVLRGEAPGPRG